MLTMKLAADMVAEFKNRVNEMLPKSAEQNAEIQKRLIDEEIKELTNEFAFINVDVNCNYDFMQLISNCHDLHIIKQRNANMLKELCDVIYVVAGMDLVKGTQTDKSKILDTYLTNVATDTLRSLITEAFTAVHSSNMMKVKAPVIVDGKIQKGENYIKPNLQAIIDKYIQ